MILIIYGIIGVIYGIIGVIGNGECYASAIEKNYRNIWLVIIVHILTMIAWPISLISSIIYTLITNKEEA